ncbi:MAG: ATP cone domain-containing protein, partial [Thermoplasmatales archaeon]
MKVKKRSGLIQKFNYNKILRSVSRAIQSAGVVDDAKKISEIICERIKSSGKSTIDAEEIASVVEQVLMEQCPLAAKQYIIYRNKRKEIYEIEKNFTCDLINNYIDKVDWRVRENANIAFSLQGL